MLEINFVYIRNGLRDLGHNPNESQVNLLLAQIDADGNGIIDNDELITFMRSQVSLDDPVGDLSAVYRLLLKDSNNKEGGVCGRNIRNMLLRYALAYVDSFIYLDQDHSEVV